MLKILFVSSGMRLRDNTTPGLTEMNSNDHNSALRNIVLPILIAFALLAISLAILYAFFRQFRQKRKANATETNQQVVTVCIRTNKLALSMHCWRRFFQLLILLFNRIYGPSFSSWLFIIYALSYTAPSERGLHKSSRNSSAVASALMEISICPHPLQSSPFWRLYSDSSGISMIGSTSGSHFASASLSRPAIRFGFL
jgi:hypothetical protein